jgi:hypothetical protein
MATVTNRRQKMTIEFTPPEIDEVAAELASLREAGDGWVNLLPGIVEGTVELEAPGGLFAFFGTRQPPVTMATVMPAHSSQRHVEGMSVGLMHPTGSHAIARLAEEGVRVPDGWVVRQDHPRRGLVLRTSPEAPPVSIVRWCVQAGTELCRADMTGRWQAVVYLP